MVNFKSTIEFDKKFFKLPKTIQERIKNKLQTLKLHSDIFSVLKKLYDFPPATHRLRIGNYRLVLELIKQEKDVVAFLMLDVDHRKDVYR